jgi:hypothetical protein
VAHGFPAVDPGAEIDPLEAEFRLQDPHSVLPGSEDRWQVGDDIFSTSVTVKYRLKNGDEVELRALAEKGNRSAPLSCGWTQVVAHLARMTAP